MILVAVLVSWLLDKPVEIRPVLVSKLNTVAQITLAGFALGVRAYGLDQQLAADLPRMDGRRDNPGLGRRLYRPVAGPYEPIGRSHAADVSRP